MFKLLVGNYLACGNVNSTNIVYGNKGHKSTLTDNSHLDSRWMITDEG